MVKPNIYTVGGTVQADGGIYIPRKADEEWYLGLLILIADALKLAIDMEEIKMAVWWRAGFMCIGCRRGVL